MKILYDPTTNGFHHERIDGPRKIPAAQSQREIKAGKRPKMVDNPDCRIPATATTEVGQDEFDALMQAQAEGKVIKARGKKPVAVDWEQDPDEARAMRRAKRDRLLAESDWTQLPDSPLLEDTLASWTEYRQALRDLDMDGTYWPVSPVADPLGETP